jgi:hypothetical protein
MGTDSARDEEGWGDRLNVVRRQHDALTRKLKAECADDLHIDVRVRRREHDGHHHKPRAQIHKPAPVNIWQYPLSDAGTRAYPDGTL